MDYGSLMCWATNSIGRIEEACIYHLIPAGRPDPVHNCTVVNQTYSTLHVVCLRGFDGGLPQDFTMEVRDGKTSFVVANTTNTRAATFTVTGLRPGTTYLVSISSSNDKGRSEAVAIQAYTSAAPVTERKSSPGKSIGSCYYYLLRKKLQYKLNDDVNRFLAWMSIKKKVAT